MQTIKPTPSEERRIAADYIKQFRDLADNKQWQEQNPQEYAMYLKCLEIVQGKVH